MDLTTLIGWFALYQVMPQGLRTAVEATAEALIEQAIQAAGAGTAERVAGSSEARQVRKYLARAVALTLRDHPELKTVVFATDFRKPPISDCLLQVLARPQADLDREQVVRAFSGTHYDLPSLGIDPVDLLREIQQRFARELRADQKTRSLGVVAVVERMASDTAALRADLDRRSARERTVTPLLNVEQFFRPWLRPNRLFSHPWTIVGRAELRDQLAPCVCPCPLVSC